MTSATRLRASLSSTFDRKPGGFSMTGSLMLLAALILVALIFDFLNGLHDAANSIATVVSTRVLSPHIAVAWAAFFNFIAFLFFGLHVAQTIGTGIISPDVVDWRAIFGALMGDRVESTNLVGRNSLVELACSDWRANRRGSGERRDRCSRLVGHAQDRSGNCMVAAAWLRSGAPLVADCLVAIRSEYALCRGSILPRAATWLCCPLLRRAWCERCAENHGDHCQSSLC